MTRAEFWTAIGPDGQSFFRELSEAFGPLTIEAAWRVEG